MELRQVERYWETLVELVSAIKGGTTSNLMGVLVVKSKAPKEAPVVDVEEILSVNLKEKAHAFASANTAGPVHPFSYYA